MKVQILIDPLTILNNRHLTRPIQNGAVRRVGDGMKLVVMFSAVAFAVASGANAQDAGWPDESETVIQQSESNAPAEVSGGDGWNYDWSGNYFGVSAAYGMGAHDTVGLGGVDTSGQDLSGGMFGAFLGHNYQVSRIVFGSEMDFNLASLNGPFTMPGSAIACDVPGVDCSTDVDWVASLRGRAGVPIYDFLPYVTAGIAGGGVNTRFEGPGVDTTISGVGFGWVLGAGLEYAVMKHLNVRGEILHYNLSDIEESVLGTDVTADTRFTVVRAGASLKF